MNANLFLQRQLIQLHHINLVVHNHERFVHKQGLDIVKQSHLLLNAVVTQFADIQHKQNYGFQMGQGSYRLHLYRVPFLQRMIQNSWSVDYLR